MSDIIRQKGPQNLKQKQQKLSTLKYKRKPHKINNKALKHRKLLSMSDKNV